jgi:hypothetical protein
MISGDLGRETAHGYAMAWRYPGPDTQGPGLARAWGRGGRQGARTTELVEPTTETADGFRKGCGETPTSVRTASVAKKIAELAKAGRRGADLIEKTLSAFGGNEAEQNSVH